MGMFDSVYVAKSLIDNLIKDTDVLLESFEGYYDFQTKDLDNFLTAFYIENDGSFVWEKREYKEREVKENDPIRYAPLEFCNFYRSRKKRQTCRTNFY
jgi:hypothetical protein